MPWPRLARKFSLKVHLKVLIASAASFVLGALLILEVLRPFRDLKIDGPIALLFWIIGIVCAALSLWLKKDHVVLHWTLILLNGSAVILTLLALFLIGSSKKLF
jgi:hypothetical protein